MNKSFDEKFKSEMSCNPESMWVKYAELRENKSIQKFVFVEGPSDEKFYGRTNNAELGEKESYYLYPGAGGDDPDEKGKKAVIKSFEVINTHPDLKGERDRRCFIVDRDYDFERIKGINRTNGHSVECYFFEENNLHLVFQYLNISEKCYGEFIEMYRDFAASMKAYYVNKGTYTYAVARGYKVRIYENGDEKLDLFFCDNEYTFINKAFFENETEKIQKALGQDANLRGYSTRLKTEIGNRIDMVRGHDAYYFLREYLIRVHGIKIGNYFEGISEVIPKMNVKFLD